MSTSDYSHQHLVLPTAPPLPAVSTEDEMAPPSYEEAIRAPSAGGSFNNVPSALLPEAARDGVSLPAGGTADARADAEAGRIGPRQTNSTATANTIPPPPPLPPPASGDDPPSYHSLFGQIKEAKESSSGLCDFMLNLMLMPVGCLVGLVLVAAVVGLVFGVPLTLLVVGSLYVHECPIEPGIPVWMIVGGAVMIVYIIWVVCTDEEASGRQAVVGALFYIAWYIAGCVLIYPTWQPDFQPSYDGDLFYCDYTAMLTAFVIINLMSVLTAVSFCGGCL